jgi:uncharacterized membrane protein
MGKIRHYFGTGLLVTLPVFITLYIMFVGFRFIDNIWGKAINTYLKNNFGFSIPGLGIIIGIVTVFVIGFIATSFIGKRTFRGIEGWFLKFPLIKQIYPSAKQVVTSIMSKENPSFKKVVLVEYPSKGIWVIGFVTNDGLKDACDKTGEDLIHVFIATTPSPLTGSLVLVPRSAVKVLDIPVEQGIKLIVSGGIVKR